MTGEEVAVALEKCKQEIGSLKHRMDDQEDKSERLNKLVLSVQKLAINMESMMKQLSETNERLKVLESVPAESWSTLKKTIFTAIAGTLAGGAAVWFLQGLVNYVK